MGGSAATGNVNGRHNTGSAGGYGAGGTGIDSGHYHSPGSPYRKWGSRPGRDLLGTYRKWGGPGGEADKKNGNGKSRKQHGGDSGR